MGRSSLSVLPVFFVRHRHTLVGCVVARRDVYAIGLILAHNPLLSCCCVIPFPFVCRMGVCSLQIKYCNHAQQVWAPPPHFCSPFDRRCGGWGAAPQAPPSGVAQSAATPADSTRPPYSAPPRPLYLQRPERGVASVLAPTRPSTDARAENRPYDGGAVSSDRPAPAGVDHADPVQNPSRARLFVRTNLPDDGMPSVGAMLYRAGVGGSPKPARVRPSGPSQQSIDVVDDSDDGLRSASAFDIFSSSDSPVRDARACKRRRSGKAKQVAPTRRQRKSSATAMAADGDEEFKNRGDWAAKYRFLMLKR